MQSLKNPGIATALGAAILFGASAPLAKLLLEGAAPQLLAGLFYLGSGIGLGVVWLRRRQSAEVARERPLTRHDLPWLAGAIGFGGALAPLLLMTGLARTPASATSLLLNRAVRRRSVVAADFPGAADDGVHRRGRAHGHRSVAACERAARARAPARAAGT